MGGTVVFFEDRKLYSLVQARYLVEHSEHRDLIVQRLRADVLGPEIYDDSATSKEILNLRDPVSPQYHYVIGHLHPQQWGGEEL